LIQELTQNFNIWKVDERCATRLYKDEALIMQLLRDNLHLWTANGNMEDMDDSDDERRATPSKQAQAPQ